ncbi:MAG TPA: hypothetical protein VKV02_04995 [Acidobacteriaceae bacterium]|nr:hypothetical protein [Acidobacteriaceae bacterium]
MTGPLELACSHIATPQERERDPGYLACAAAPGQPCVWALRFDGVTDPPFHSERLEAGLADTKLAEALDTQTFREAVLETGLV